MKHPILSAMLLPLLLTGCSVNIPEPDPIPAPVPEVTEAPPTEAPTERPTRPPVLSDPTGESGEATEAETEPETEETTEPPPEPWQVAYETLLSAKVKASAPKNSGFALIRLDADDVPELVVLEDGRMELYCFDGEHAAMLLEDGYKTEAAQGQNVCYQPETGLFSSAFSTMGGGSGFNIYAYAAMSTLHVERYCFRDIEYIEDGDLPYNPIWDRAEEFGVHCEGYRDVRLDDRWVQIGEECEGYETLTAAHAEQVGHDWQPREDEED